MEQASSIGFLTEGTIWKRITSFALPIFLGNLFQQLYNTVDSLIVGNFLGSNALAAVSSSGNLTFLLIGFLNGIAIGAGVVIARYFGARDAENMQRAIHTIVAFGLAASVAMTVIGVLLTPQILIWMDTPTSVMPNSVVYLKIYFMGSLGFVMYNVFVGILQAVGDSRHPLYYLIISSIINVVLDLVFIGVFHTGVEGAAVATAFSQLVSAVLCLIQLMRTREPYRVSLRKIRFDAIMLKQVIHLGLPSGVQNSIVALANVIVQANINSFGEMAMAGCGAFSKIEGFAFLPINSFSMALPTFIGQNIGAGKYERAAKGARFGILSSVILAEVIGMLILVFAPALTAAFESTPEVIQFGVERARTSAPFFCLLAYSHSMGAVMRGEGKPVVSMLVMMICWCVIRVSFLSLVIPLTNNIQFVYWAYPMTWLLSSIAFFVYYKKADRLHSFA